MNQPSAARKPCRMPGHGVPMGMPMDQKLGTTSSMATMASSMATSTRWGRPVRSRWRSAARRADHREQRGGDVAQPAHRRADRWLALRAA